MAFYDMLMIVVLAGTTLWGVYKGMAWQIAAFASVILSAVVAINASPAFAPWFSAQEPWNRYLAMLVLYMITAAAIWIVFHLVSNIIDRVKLKEFDRQIGAMFGFVKGILYCVVITFFFVTLGDTSRELVLESRSGDLIARGIRNATPLLPEDIRAHLGKYLDQLDAQLNQSKDASSPTAPPLEPTNRDEGQGGGDKKSDNASRGH